MKDILQEVPLVPPILSPEEGVLPPLIPKINPLPEGNLFITDHLGQPIQPKHSYPTQEDWFNARRKARGKIIPNGKRNRNQNRKEHEGEPTSFDNFPSGIMALAVVVTCYSCGKMRFLAVKDNKDAVKHLSTACNCPGHPHGLGWVEMCPDDATEAEKDMGMFLWLCPTCFSKFYPDSDQKSRR